MNVCITCGACCASFRVDFSVFETESEGGSVPDGLWVSISEGIARLRGTDYGRPRCAALCGSVGVRATCGIYEWRPSPCREFPEGGEACAQARRRHGLAAL
ncbi:MAG: YkgJ family cysteine cluster protein [Burkholderiaceae bacterium]|nr:YkgJ family cysteine cluster protein [Burkholderiaceae bacterium]